MIIEGDVEFTSDAPIVTREWIRLTDEEADTLRQTSDLNFVTFREFRIIANAIENALREKNGI